jgi:glucokinase
VDGRAQATNLPWVIDERLLTYAIPAPRVKLLNDLEVAAHGVLGLPDEDLRSLQQGRAAAGQPGAHRGRHRASARPLIIRDGDRRIVIPSEGGHGDPGLRATTSRRPAALPAQGVRARVLRARAGGRGPLQRVPLPARHRLAKESPAVAERMRKENPNAIVSELGLSKRDALCDKALDIFVAVYWREAGNLGADGDGGGRRAGGRRHRATHRRAAGGRRLRGRVP